MEGVYHSDGGSNDADLDDEDGWIDLGPEDADDKSKSLNTKLDEAKQHGMSEDRLKELKNLLIEYGNVIKTKLDAGTPADIAPLKVNLKPDSIPVRTKQRRYSAPKKSS